MGKYTLQVDKRLHGRVDFEYSTNTVDAFLSSILVRNNRKSQASSICWRTLGCFVSNSKHVYRSKCIVVPANALVRYIILRYRCTVKGYAATSTEHSQPRQTRERWPGAKIDCKLLRRERTTTSKKNEATDFNDH